MNYQNHSYKENLLIMGGHLADDLCQGSLPAILAFMYQEGKLSSYADVAFLIMATTIVNAIAQPLTGYLSDKKPRPYLMCLGMLIAALGVAFIGFIDNYLLLCAAVAVNGIGVATFHPSAGKLANIFAGKKVGRGMSIFSVGGNIGYAIGPLYFTAGYMLFGLKATILILIPALIMAFIFIRRNRKYLIYSKRTEARTRRRLNDATVKDNYFGTFLLILLVFARSAAMFSLTTFLPLYFMHELGQKEEVSTLANTIVAGAGAIATLIGGPMADRFGFTQWVRFTSVVCVPFGVLFILTHNPLLSVAALIPLALFYYAAMSPIVVIGQKMLPQHVGMATGITIGLGISFGGIIAPVLGNLGDKFGLDATMLAVVCLTGLSALLSFVVPIVNRPVKEKITA